MQRVQNNWDDIARARVKMCRGPRIESETLATLIVLALAFVALSFLAG